MTSVNLVNAGKAKLAANQGNAVIRPQGLVGPAGPGGSDAGVAGYIADKTSATRTALNAPFGPVVSFASLPTPHFLNHRGGDALMPENTMDAFDTTLSQGQGQIILETDVSMLRDGTLVIMHDPTIDRTTDGTGNVIDQDAVSWRGLNTKTNYINDVTNNAVWNATKPPTLDDLLRKHGNKALMSLEPKFYPAGQDLIQRMCDSLDRWKINPDTVVLNLANLANATQVFARGYRSIISGTTFVGVDWANLAANGVLYYAVVNTTAMPTLAQSAAAHAAGVRILSYYPYSRVEVAAGVAVGVDAFTTHDAIWMRGTLTSRTTDSWARKVPTPGMMGRLSGNRDKSPAFVGTNEIELLGNHYIRIGEVSPTASPNVTVDFDMTLTTASGVAGQDFRVFLSDTDNVYDGSAGANGYAGLFQPGSTPFQRSYVLTKGGPITQLQTATRTTWTTGATLHFRLQITPTSVVWTETTNSWTITDTSGNATLYRPSGGWYLFFGSVGTNVFRIKNLVIT